MISNTKCIVLPVLFASMALLGACHKNPITQVKPSKTVMALWKASRAAEKQLGVPRSSGWVYSNCMDENKAKVNCEAFFKAMLVFARQDVAFKHLTYAELTDKDAFEPIAEDYFIQYFNNVD